MTCPENTDGLHRIDYGAAEPLCVDCGAEVEPCEQGSPQWLLNVARFNEARVAELAEQTYTLAGWFDDKAVRVFTIGLARFGKPEIVLTAPDDDFAGRAVEELADLAADGTVMKGGDVVDLRDPDGDVVMEFRLIDLPVEVTRDSDLFNQAHGLAGGRHPIPAVQAVWPGRHVSSAEGAPLTFPQGPNRGTISRCSPTRGGQTTTTRAG